METIGIFGGSFNPVHVGHTMLASYLVQWGYVDKLWLTLSPLNPLKEAGTLLPDMKRLDMLSIAVRGCRDIDTLDLLRERYPDVRFKLIIGSDNWRIFDQWREAQRILDDYGVIVYLRPGYPVEDEHVYGLEVVHAPMADLSSTFIRNAIAKGRDMNFFLPAGVYKYIVENKLYTGTAGVNKK